MLVCKPYQDPPSPRPLIDPPLVTVVAVGIKMRERHVP